MDRISIRDTSAACGWIDDWEKRISRLPGMIWVALGTDSEPTCSPMVMKQCWTSTTINALCSFFVVMCSIWCWRLSAVVWSTTIPPSDEMIQKEEKKMNARKGRRIRWGKVEVEVVVVGVVVVVRGGIGWFVWVVVVEEKSSRKRIFLERKKRRREGEEDRVASLRLYRPIHSILSYSFYNVWMSMIIIIILFIVIGIVIVVVMIHYIIHFRIGEGSCWMEQNIYIFVHSSSWI